MVYGTVVAHPLFPPAHSEVQALSILSRFFFFRAWWFLVRALVPRNSACWDFFFFIQGRAYFISSHINAVNWAKSSDFMCQEPDCAETHTYLHPYSLNSLHHFIKSWFMVQAPGESRIAQEVLSLIPRLYSIRYQKHAARDLFSRALWHSVHTHIQLLATLDQSPSNKKLEMLGSELMPFWSKVQQFNR